MAKDKPIKNKWLGARADEALNAEVTAYLEASDDLTMGALVRKAVKEYMLNHPHKEPQPTAATITKPGE